MISSHSARVRRTSPLDLTSILPSVVHAPMADLLIATKGVEDRRGEMEDAVS